MVWGWPAEQGDGVRVYAAVVAVIAEQYHPHILSKVLICNIGVSNTPTVGIIDLGTEADTCQLPFQQEHDSKWYC